MAFNFNWSPLIADTSRARDMLTTALNKSPKPPIIVDDIIVTELNLGQTPPELEILEIGDLAEDRFRGIFKMQYTGDAFLTLKTRVQANPLNTYLSEKPTFASPQPLAASSGLTIPLQITLSDIRLSGFVILVFSRQKGLTLVFRNDPLESLRVSSTFDSIPFVRDYLQKEIEKQLRVLFMEDLPAILHRLSLQMFSPEYQEMEDKLRAEAAKKLDTIPVDPMASPPQNPVDAFGNPIDESQSPFFLDPSTETHASFSQKNLLRLAALTESHRTLSLFTPSIRDAVFRAWAGATERENSGTQTPTFTTSSLSRMTASLVSAPSSTPSLSDITENDSISSRPTLQSFGSSTYGLSMGASTNRARAHGGRKRKKRVVNLRRPTESADNTDASSVSTGTYTMTSTPAASVVSAPASIIVEDREREVDATDPVTPPRSPSHRVRFRSHSRPRSRQESVDGGRSAEPTPKAKGKAEREREVPRITLDPPPVYQPPTDSTASTSSSSSEKRPAGLKSTKSHHGYAHSSSSIPLMRSYSLDKLSFPTQGRTQDQMQGYEGSGGILEQAWLMKMATEIARKVREEEQQRKNVMSSGDKSGSGNGKEKEVSGMVDRGREETPPPAYGV
ncbi:hypothetical protein K402DRAFT_394814 [Aulographum hederae CBS 113979]|uniref:Mitochondrial distribution and morphology protein 34 n=1 Tax=Aulographum hederae CBS 113979 TaxID=1176131 RepID=A0A6G1GXI4_9PEZI|nr:hypothetical protein K402DRAFT_394814 [Aulographum hederae CBS 113979]